MQNELIKGVTIKMVDFRKIIDVIVEYEYFDTGIVSSYSLVGPNENIKVSDDGMALSATLVSDEQDEQSVEYEVKVIDQEGKILIGGSVISDGNNEYPASLSVENDGYVVVSEDTSQRATISLYFA